MIAVIREWVLLNGKQTQAVVNVQETLQVFLSLRPGFHKQPFPVVGYHVRIYHLQGPFKGKNRIFGVMG